ncbi:RNA polymerase sigma factor [Deminuibacter soli]|uniref:RNA polymerase sigma-70 region 2 domain-containing protein n=1 Tax=Deminuibacter soli TaxID=2291815 RepID=A0A3E1NPY8_9BACT|nr:hypothetical protein [Deminuibacter soli]RFM29967.1 hypothetical protein DXN05_03055 [Deminuibacter soli]
MSMSYAYSGLTHEQKQAQLEMALASGSETALYLIQELYTKTLLFHVYNQLRNTNPQRNTIERIIMDAYISLWAVKDNYRSIAAVKSFLYQTTTEACEGYCRRYGKPVISTVDTVYPSAPLNRRHMEETVQEHWV